ncbi:hybrid sensor histidine kinase/response regulator [Govanella unica]|uniref:Chemotaxis protein CheA n=1 Tax=Govanella unica TaxID=2975056 RepID=A0A9X3TWV2_9PROT|nr:chemotaxis protein CheW [Govania unica]MDA5193165.1 chemotaxis protein CheW [Govania unica]
MDDLLNEFLTETAESIDVIDVELVKLEQNPNNKGVLDNIFRLVHTIKGTCGFLGLPRLEAVAHASENVLGKFRDGELEVTAGAVSIVLESLDCIKEILAGLASTEAEPVGNDKDLIGRLNVCASGGAAVSKKTIQAVEKPIELRSDVHLGRELLPGEISLEELEAAFNAAPGPDDEDIVLIAEADEPEPVIESLKQPEAKAEAKGETSIGTQSIRVNVDLLENLMNMVSELVLTRNQLLQILRRSSDSEFSVPLQRLSQCTTELQEGVMKTRMQPIGNAWAKLPRIIRDLSMELNKKIDLQMIGAETELDRQVLELIKDPLTHMVRNSADHGIEMPRDRAASGKAETGTIRLNAYHEGGHIIVEVADDGAGLKVGKLKQKILQKGLASEAELADMSDLQVQKFIFHPGFSTAEAVTNISGRGVGMDVVRSNIEKIGGTIDLKSVEGKGTSFSIKIPLTLAIVSALIVECSTERFAIPQISVLELVRVSGDSEQQIEHINNTPVMRLRDRLLPLISLDKVLALGSKDLEERFIVVTQVGAFTFGIVVDRVFDTEEIVVKPVAPILRDLQVYSGNTILGDGNVIMILDPNGIATLTGDILVDNDHMGEADARAEIVAEDRESMLLFRAGSETQRAVPLSLVARLEEIPVESIEAADGALMVQYRGQLMPLLLVDSNCSLKTSGRQPVLVFTDNERSMGIAVDEIIDIVEEKLEIELASIVPGIIGTAVLAKKATEIADVAFYLTRAFGEKLRGARRKTVASDDGRHVLMVDDSAFFRNLLKPLLLASGYKVTSVATASEALKLREDGARFDVIVSDIEMPGMDGFAFASTVRKDGAWAETPIVALSAHATPQDFARGREVGFNDYVAKFDRDALLASLSEQLAREGDAA